ncbi:MAG: hypothetical protein IPM02_18365 [Betaproteobacteria bacterium]|nr:hypothetical protein [Betaproteobacteria bacterium]
MTDERFTSVGFLFRSVRLYRHWVRNRTERVGGRSLMTSRSSISRASAGVDAPLGQRRQTFSLKILPASGIVRPGFLAIPADDSTVSSLRGWYWPQARVDDILHRGVQS